MITNPSVIVRIGVLRFGLTVLSSSYLIVYIGILLEKDFKQEVNQHKELRKNFL